METLQLERFDEYGYTFISPRWVMFPLHNGRTEWQRLKQVCFFREYCKELKVSLNNTQFLLDFNQYIDKYTPNACKFCTFFCFCRCFFFLENGDKFMSSL